MNSLNFGVISGFLRVQPAFFILLSLQRLMVRNRLRSSVLVKPVSARCNMRCGYCFYRGKKDLPEGGDSGRMDREVLDSLIRQVMESTEGPVGIAWQGGEPLLAGLDFFESVVELEKRYGRSGQVVSNAVQTNGLLLDEDWAEFLARYRFLVGISLDGSAPLNDRYRTTPDLRGTFDRVFPSLELLRRYGVAFNLMVVLSDVNVRHPKELYEFCVENELRFVQFMPAVEADPDGGAASFSMPPDRYGDFLCAMFDLWYNDGRPVISVRMFDAFLERLLTGQNGICFFRDSCDGYLVAEANGDVYTCDFFVEPRWNLGNLMQLPLRDLEHVSRRTAFSSLKDSLPRACLECGWRDYCMGGCPKYRGMREPNYMCDGYRKFFSHAMPRLRELARSIEPGLNKQRRNGS